MPYSNSSSLSVLIVDDVRATRAILKSILRTLGIYQVIEAGDGGAALDLLATNRVDLVITDICMKPMDGNEFIRRLRQPTNSFNPYVPVLMVSAHTEESRIKHALQGGVTGFLMKPVTPIALEAKLNAVLSAPCRPVSTELY